MILAANFFDRETVEVARGLLGKLLVRKIGKNLLKARIMETEAYHGQDDLASHASHGVTKRTKVMYGQPGKIYIYLVYGKYYCLNIVTMPLDFPAAVLIRAVKPILGLKLMLKNRGQNIKKERVGITNLTDGPGKLCQALEIGKKLNNHYLSREVGLWIEDDGYQLDQKEVKISKRIGVDYAQHCRDWP